MAKTATVYAENGSVALVVNSIRREGNKLVIDGSALGAMRMDMILTPGELVNTLRLAFCWSVVFFILLLPFFGLKRLFKPKKKDSQAESL
jgi:hypothetical protein